MKPTLSLSNTFHKFVCLQNFEKCKITVSDKKQIIEFNDEDELEEFYEEYGYEPDEQSKEIQQKSIREIPDNRLNNWLNELFIGHISEKIITKTLY